VAIVVGKAVEGRAFKIDPVLWKKVSQNDAEGWEARLLDLHQGRVEAIAFQPNTLLLASADADGCLGLWRKGCLLAQKIETKSLGFSTLAWHPSGRFLAAGGQGGDWTIWKAAPSGQGFG